MALFGTDGVRGEAGSFINPYLVIKLAMAAGIYFRKNSITNRILVGKDTRKSGYMIENALVSGFTAVGYDVIQIGPMPTPAIAFLTESMRCDAGIMISASHNPYYDNGIKFFDYSGDKLQPNAEQEIEKIYNNEELINSNIVTGKKIGSSKRIDDVIGRYIVQIKNTFPKDKTLHGKRVVVDTANGAAYKVAPTVFEELGADIVVINAEPNGYNINEDCGAMHAKNLAKEVVKYRADVGFALDGDADRLVVVDENGEIIDGDKLLGALCLSLKNRGELSGNGCCVTKMSNGALDDFLKDHDIEIARSDVGDKYVVESMKKHGYNFGGEQSGHIIFGDSAKTGDGLLSALQAMASLMESNKPASELFNPFELYPQLQKAIVVSKKIPLKEIDGYTGLIESIDKLGIRTLIRYSGTENKLRILLEGKDKKILKEQFDKVILFFNEVL